VVDLFEEVEEELRTEQLKQLGRRALPWIVGLVVGALVIGGGYIGYTTWANGRADRAAEMYQQGLETLQRGDTEGAFNTFAEVAQKGTPIYKNFAYTQQGAIRLEQGKPQDAATLFTKAAEAAPNSPYGLIFSDLARLKSARALLDTAPYADLEARLKPLTDPKRPYSVIAREDLAWAKLRAGKVAEARNDFVSLQAAIDAPESVTQRAQGAVSMIDSGAGAELPKLVEAIRNLPPPMPQGTGLSPEQLQQLLGGAQGAPAQ
jgi:hypothetical protein